MKIEDLQIELRPRSNAQALDLGYTLLRAHGRAAWQAWLALWLPLALLCAVLTMFAPSLGGLWIMLLWWCKPLIERAPLYVLSRKVFGADVTWQEAVRAWPRQLGGGMFSLLTWKRPFSPGRGLAQPVWQLEAARGAVARKRIRLLSGNSTGASAAWFGAVCAHLEFVLQLGLIGVIGIFMSGAGNVNPFAMFAAGGAADPRLALVYLAIYASAAAVMGPIYTACCFTLYLNRRASLEAWDLELKLRQFGPPAAARPRRQNGLLGWLLVLSLLAPVPPLAPQAQAAEPAPECVPPAVEQHQTRSPFPTAEQVRVRKQLDALYATPELRGYECVRTWKRKRQAAKEDEAGKDTPALPPLDLPLLAAALKVLLIAAAIGLVGWLAYRYRSHLPRFGEKDEGAIATEIGGLDIRAESLPADVPGDVRALWAEGRSRAALALLYRATLSHLVSDDRLDVRRGDTEADCLRRARQSQQSGRISRARLDVTVTATSLWTAGAYADRWPDDAALYACCDAWQAQFGQPRQAAARGRA